MPSFAAGVTERQSAGPAAAAGALLSGALDDGLAITLDDGHRCLGRLRAA